MIRCLACGVRSYGGTEMEEVCIDDHLETIDGSTEVPGRLIAPRSSWVCRPVWRRGTPYGRFSFLPSFLAVVGVVYRRELMRAMGIARCMP